MMAQHICGTTMHDQMLMSEMFDKAGLDRGITKRGDVIYIPVRFHLIADKDGKGRVPYSAVLNQLAKLNTDYKVHNFKFYLKDNYNFKTIDNDKFFENPRDNESEINKLEDNKALNVFIVKTIGGSGVGNGEVLGYYSPEYDFIVIKQNEVTKLSNTLSHEVGHFFNLRHTFFGWEQNPWNANDHGEQVFLNFAPNTNIPVELVNRSNCTQAADQLCDTPSEFNFGNSINTCSWPTIVRDKNGDTLKPMVNNQMAYFNGCSEFKFTADQEKRMRTNFANNLRAYLKSSYIPNTDSLPPISKPIFPIIENGVKDTFYVYNDAEFIWESQNADYFLFEIKSSSLNIARFTNEPRIRITEMAPNKSYVYQVRAFNDGYTATSSSAIQFVTGNLNSTSTKDDINVVKNMAVYPNPSFTNEDFIIGITSAHEERAEIQVADLLGRVIYTKDVKLEYGENEINVEGLKTSGIYIVNVKNERGSISKRFSIR
ncbi:MAG: hypothetical protein RLZZ546_1975 [Bacteroidota bacterium]